MTTGSVLVPIAETLAGMYEDLMAALPPSPGTERLLDALFESIEAIDALTNGEVGQRARGVLGPMTAGED